MDKTKIEWADATLNVVTGCNKVSEGCRYCYAESMAHRFWKNREFSDVQLHPERIEQLRKWRKPRRVFICSMSDLFHPQVPFEFIDKLFYTWSHGNRRHTLIILTKRAERMQQYFDRDLSKVFWNYEPSEYTSVPYPDPKIWVGVSVEDQDTANYRVPWLLRTRAAVKFVSYEPALGELNLFTQHSAGVGEMLIDGLDWILAGGETGVHARPTRTEWIQDIRDQCIDAHIPFFFKHWGEWRYVRSDHPYPENLYPSRVGKKTAGRLLDGKEWNEFPNTGKTLVEVFSFTGDDHIVGDNKMVTDGYSYAPAQCPRCGGKMQVVRVGDFRCSECES